MTAPVATPPMPPGLPVIGHVLDFAADPPGYLLRLTKQYGDVVDLRFGNRRITLVTRPALVAQILQHQSKKFKKPYKGFPALAALIGNGLLSSDGEFWLRQRRLAQPAFHKDKIRAYAETMRAYTVRSLENLHGDLDMHAFWDNLTLEIVAKTLFNAEIHGDSSSRIGHALEEALSANKAQMAQPFPLPLEIPLPGHKRLKRAIAELDAVVHEMIERERAQPSGYSLLSMLVAARDVDGSAMTDAQLRDEALTLLLAGYETTANALSWAVHLLVNHPQHLETAEREARAVVQGDGCGLEELPRLTFLKQVWMETLRLYPTAWSIGRSTLEPVQLGEYALPKRRNIMLAQYVTHRDPTLFPDPEAFKPERWTPEFERSLPDYAYFPFSAGPRVCIGNAFADMEGLILLATVLKHVHLERGPRYDPSAFASLTLRPKNGISVRATPVSSRPEVHA
jgi:cytochrome P450